MDERRPNVIQQVFKIRGMGQVIIVTGFFIVMTIVFGIMSPNFLSGRNISNVIRQISPFIIAGIGQSYVLITGNIDLSIGSVVGMSNMIAATLMSTYGVNPWLAAAITMVACIILGVLNGTLVANFKLPPFIATLGTMMVARGIAQGVNEGYNTGPIIAPEPLADKAAELAAFKDKADFFKNFFYYGQIGPIFSTLIVALVLWGFFNFILSRTKTGRHIYAVGSNIEAAKMSGVSVSKTVITAYVVSAFCASVVGFIMTAQTGQGAMNTGTTYEMYAVAASVIGGVSTLGGQGILLGTVVGACVWAGLANGLSINGSSLAVQNITIGIIVVISVLSDVLIRQRKK